MKPATKATIALPFTLGLIAFVFYSVIAHPAILIYPLIFVSGVGIIGSVWYALYRCFGGDI
jgi:hypothetical protein